MLAKNIYYRYTVLATEGLIVTCMFSTSAKVVDVFNFWFEM